MAANDNHGCIWQCTPVESLETSYDLSTGHATGTNWDDMRVAMRTETSFLIGIHHETSLIVAIPAVAFATLPQVGAQDRNSKESRLVRAAKPITPTPFEPPNRLIWRLSEVLAAHKGQASWRQPVVKTRDFEADWISMAPGEKTKAAFTRTIAFSGSLNAGKCE